MVTANQSLYITNNNLLQKDKMFFGNISKYAFVFTSRSYKQDDNSEKYIMECSVQLLNNFEHGAREIVLYDSINSPSPFIFMVIYGSRNIFNLSSDRQWWDNTVVPNTTKMSTKESVCGLVEMFGFVSSQQLEVIFYHYINMNFHNKDEYNVKYDLIFHYKNNEKKTAKLSLMYNDNILITYDILIFDNDDCNVLMYCDILYRRSIFISTFKNFNFE